MRLLSVDTIEEARGKIFDAASERKPETETVHFTESCGRGDDRVYGEIR